MKQPKYTIDYETRVITFTNPYRTKSRENKPEYKDHTREIREGVDIDMVAAELQNGIAVKMALAHEAVRKK